MQYCPPWGKSSFVALNINNSEYFIADFTLSDWEGNLIQRFPPSGQQSQKTSSFEISKEGKQGQKPIRQFCNLVERLISVNVP